MNYSFDNSSISHSHQAVSYFDVDILQSSKHSFHNTHKSVEDSAMPENSCAWDGGREKTPRILGGHMEWGICEDNVLPCCSIFMSMSNKSSECTSHSPTPAVRRTQPDITCCVKKIFYHSSFFRTQNCVLYVSILRNNTVPCQRCHTLDSQGVVKRLMLIEKHLPEVPALFS